MDKLRAVVEIEDDAPSVDVLTDRCDDEQTQMRVEISHDLPSETEKNLVEELFDWLFTEACQETDLDSAAA